MTNNRRASVVMGLLFSTVLIQSPALAGCKKTQYTPFGTFVTYYPQTCREVFNPPAPPTRMLNPNYVRCGNSEAAVQRLIAIASDLREMGAKTERFDYAEGWELEDVAASAQAGATYINSFVLSSLVENNGQPVNCYHGSELLFPVMAISYLPGETQQCAHARNALASAQESLRSLNSEKQKPGIWYHSALVTASGIIGGVQQGLHNFIDTYCRR